MTYQILPDNYRLSRGQLAVVVSGIVSMGLEIVAGRVLAPEFGSTIYTWGSIIGVSMLALSLGYYHGGKKAEETTQDRLEKLLIFTSLYILLLVFAGEVILTFTSELAIGPRYAALLPVAVLFGPPTYFLGYISPYAVQLSSKDVKGEASGHFYAIGTAGSIVGAFATTFILIPSLKVNHIYLLFSVLALLPTLRGFRDWRLLLIPLVILSSLAVSSSSGILGETIYTDSTPYQDLRIDDQDGVRTLYLDGDPHSAAYIDGRDSYAWEYPRYFHLSFLIRDDVDKVLFIGGGGFTAPQRFAKENVTVHAVEIDPGVIEAAEKHFNLSESENLKIYQADGRQFLQETEHEYDAVVVDAYRKYKVPFHLTTREFFELVHRKTDEDGLVAINIISSSEGPSSQLARSEYKTIDTVFNTVYMFETEDPDQVQNVEIIGSKRERFTKDELQERNENYTEMNLSEEIRNLREKPVKTSDVPLLTDQHAPVERLIEPIIGQSYIKE